MWVTPNSEMSMEPRLRNLLKQGERAARLGKMQAAEDVYRQAVALFPNSAEAWLGLSQVAPSEAERLMSSRQAARLDPALADSTPEGAADLEKPSSQLDAVLLESQTRLRQATGGAAVNEARWASPSPVREPETETAVAQAMETTTCFYHPALQTSLRCNRCSKPICTRCAVSTPVGYRCKDCVREQQGVFYSALWYDYVVGAVVTVPLAAIALVITSGVGWLTIFVAPFAGGLVGEAVRLVTRRRRGRWLPLVVSVAMVAGGALGFLFSRFSLGSIVWQVVFLVLGISSAYYRVR